MFRNSLSPTSLFSLTTSALGRGSATILATGLLLAFAGCTGAATETSAPAPAGTEARAEAPAEKKSEFPVVTIKTNKGAIEVELYPDKAPDSVKNFLQYAKDGHYNDTIFHRVIKDFMIQGGGFAKDRTQKPTRDPIKNEADNGLKNDRGTIAMARTSVPDSATAQFFINTVDNDFLNYTAPTVRGYGYAVFGRVIEGMDIVDAIAAIPTENKGGAFAALPSAEVIIETVTEQ